MNSNADDHHVQKSFDFFEEIPSNAPAHKESSEVTGQSNESGTNTNTVRPLNDLQLEQLYRSVLALNSLKGIGFKSICDAFDNGFLVDIWNNPDSLIEHPFVYDHVAPELHEFAKRPEAYVESKSEPIRKDLENSLVKFTALGHSSYPDALNRLADPPRWLFIQGNLENLYTKSVVTVVGTRDASEVGIDLAKQLGGVLARQNLIVASGLAKGIDEAAHLGCLEYYGLAIGALGQGIRFSRISKVVESLQDTILAREGTIISEYLPDDPPSRRTFLRRNALLVALAQVVIPVEFPNRESGTGGTILRARKLNIPVVGFLPKTTTDKSILATLENFELEHIPVHRISENLSEVVTQVLMPVMQNHLWNATEAERQERFISAIAKRILPAKDRIGLTEAVIDKLAQRLKQEL